jgi:hypothetical protein
MEGNRKMTIETPVRPTGLDTVEEALDALADVVEGRADYVYPRDQLGGCFNIDPAQHDCPLCLIGTVLLAHGVPAELFEFGISGGAPFTANSAGIDELVTQGLIDLPSPVVGVLSAAQSCQDNLMPWRVALDAAYQHAAYFHGVPA